MSTSTTIKMTAGQTVVHNLFDTEEALTIQEIAAALGKKVPAVTSTVASLVKKGVLHKLGETFTRPEVGPAVEETTLTPVDETPAPGAIVMTDDLAAAVAECRTRQESGAETVVVEHKVNDYIKSAKVGPAWITSDGLFACAKGTLDGTSEEPWALYRVHAETLVLVGTFKTSSTPFFVATQAGHR
jgi:hypothetical protein